MQKQYSEPLVSDVCDGHHKAFPPHKTTTFNQDKQPDFVLQVEGIQSLTRARSHHIH